jgi:hypothetical protein
MPAHTQTTKSPLWVLRRAKGFANGMETAFCAFFQSLLTLFLIGGVGLAALMEAHSWQVWTGYVAIACMWFWLSWSALIQMWAVTLREGRPVAVAAALRQPIRPWILRPLAAAWWLAHFACGSFITIIVLAPASSTQHHAPPTPALTILFLATVFGYANHGFLMLLVTSVTRSPKVILEVWHYRWLVDIGLGIVAVIVTRFQAS